MNNIIITYYIIVGNVFRILDVFVFILAMVLINHDFSKDIFIVVSFSITKELIQQNLFIYS